MLEYMSCSFSSVLGAQSYSVSLGFTVFLAFDAVHHPEHVWSHLISAAKQSQAWLVSGWEKTRECQVLCWAEAVVAEWQSTCSG